MFITVFITACAGGYFALWFTKHAMVAVTSLVGSYLIMRGVSFYVGGYPNEFLLYTYFTDDEAQVFFA